MDWVVLVVRFLVVLFWVVAAEKYRNHDCIHSTLRFLVCCVPSVPGTVGRVVEGRGG